MSEDNVFYSNETNQILSKLPKKVVRWGMLILFLIFISIFLGSIWIKIPDILVYPVLLNSNNHPAIITSNSQGEIDTVFYTSGTHVNKGDIIAIIKSDSDYASILSVEKHLIESFNIKPEKLVFESWIYHEYNFKNRLFLAYSDFASICRIMHDYILKYNSSQDMELYIISNYTIQIIEHRRELLSLIAEWKSDYLITAPSTGKLLITARKNIEQNMYLGNIVPDVDSLVVTGEIIIPIAFVDKIYLGKNVDLAYKSHNLGFFSGFINNIVPLVDQEKCLAQISFPAGCPQDVIQMLSANGKINMTGKIVTGRHRLINKFIRF